MKKTAAKGHTTKHATTKSKHKKTSKHTPAKTVSSVSGAGKAKVSAVAKPAVHAKAVGLALGDGVACCAAEALAASLRLQGVRVSDEDVLALYWHTADDPDAGASILATLEAAWRFGLGGVRPAACTLVAFPAKGRGMTAGEGTEDLIGLECHAARKLYVDGVERLQELDRRGLECHCQADQLFGGHAALALLSTGDGLLMPVSEAEIPHADRHGRLAELLPSATATDVAADDFLVNHSLILGVELPGPHAVLATPDGWWSWGELHDPAEWPDAVVESAWAVTWA